MVDWWGQPALNLRVAFTMVALATEHGTSGLAAFGFGLYALASFLFDLDEGYRAGSIGLRLMEKYRAVALTAKLYGLFYAHVDIW
jgi:predicted ATPase